MARVLSEPVVLLDARDCRLLWPAIDAHVGELVRVGARARLVALAETVEAVREVAGIERASAHPQHATPADRSRSTHEPDDWISTSAAAELLGVHRSSVTRMCRRGQLEARRDGRDWAIRRITIESRNA